MRKPATTAEAPSTGEPVTVLLVASELMSQTLRQILSHSRWTVLEVETLSEAVVKLRTQPGVVVICEDMLPDGTWRELLHHSFRLPVPAPLIVAANHADDYLWMEVLNLGGYNLVGKPFNEQELFRLVSTAWLHRRNQARGRALAAS